MMIGMEHICGACGFALGVVSAVACMLVGVWVDERRNDDDKH